MNGEVLTALFTSLSGAAVGIVAPIYMTKRKTAISDENTRLVDSRAVAMMFREERDALAKDIKELRVHHETQIEQLKRDNQAAIARIEAKWRVQHETDQAQIRQLQQEVDGLYRRLYERPAQ